MITVIRRIQFCAGHRVWGHEGPCGYLHGHNYVAFFHAAADYSTEGALNELGMVIDFAVLKARLGGWIEQHWDHGFICHTGDEQTRRAMEHIPNQKLYLLDDNPTAENMARHLLQVVGPKVLEGTGVHLTRVVLWETENCYTEVSQ